MTDLRRFHDAQRDVYPGALAELRAGRKQSHWMWFIFPQLRSLGRSPTALHYGIADLAEARAYLDDPVLRERLIACFRAILGHDGLTAGDILGPVDAMKLRSSATLFGAAGTGEIAAVTRAVLDRFFDDAPCPYTVAATRTA